MNPLHQIFFNPNYNMKPHVTNLQHQKYCMLLEKTIQKMEEITTDEKMQVLEKITALKNNKKALEEIYCNYQFKIKELSNLLDEYERAHQISRINLRKLQMWLKHTYKIGKGFFLTDDSIGSQIDKS